MLRDQVLREMRKRHVYNGDIETEFSTSCNHHIWNLRKEVLMRGMRLNIKNMKDRFSSKKHLT